jgi:uncharacterized protein with HEPN domain
MPSRSAENLLLDILDNIELAREFVKGFTFKTFDADTRTAYATTRCLEIISEASRRLPASSSRGTRKIPWRAIAGAGSIYRHDYEAVLNQIVWATVHNRLDELRVFAEIELQRLKT